MIELSFWELLLRLGVACLCGGLIGIERGRKRRAAGFRTYMLVCMGASLTMILGTYLAIMAGSALWGLDQTASYAKVDVSRFGAQVINGIGFLGAGTIIITGRQQVKGMTTAAGLWASACMGLAIGAGFFLAALIGCLCILMTIVLFLKLETFILSHTRNINLYIEFASTDNLSEIIERIKEYNVRIFDVDLTKAQGTAPPHAVFSLQLPKKKSHTVLMTALATIESIYLIEEL